MIKLGKLLEVNPSLQYLATLKYMEEGSLEGSNTIYFTIENNKNTFTLSPLPEFKKISFKFGINNENRGEVKF